MATDGTAVPTEDQIKAARATETRELLLENEHLKDTLRRAGFLRFARS